MENKEIASVLKRLAKLMELHGENDFKVKSVQNASFRMERLSIPLKGLNEKQLSELDGVGKSISQKLFTLLQNGTLPELVQLETKTPEGISEILDIKGLGPKKVRVIWQELGITSPGELLYACNENRLVELKGFGSKTQDQIRQSVEFMLRNAGWFHYAEAETAATIELEFLRTKFGSIEMAVTGPVRRMCEVVAGIDILVCTSLPFLKEVLSGSRELKIDNDTGTVNYLTASGIPVRLLTVPESYSFAYTLFVTTGSQPHIDRICSVLTEKSEAVEKAATEEELYLKAGIGFIPPECREGDLEFNETTAFENLITYSDLRGCLHNHSTYSDGLHSLREMGEACRQAGLEYFGICDHSKSAFYANGLSVERVLEQHKEIELLNMELAPFRIFKGIESDILHDGSLDYPDEVLATFDFVVASVHSGLRMDEKKATERIIKAVSNPYTTILGHPTGRLLLAREGYPLDMDAVIEACAHFGVIIELNAHPYRLDLDWRWIRKATEKGVKISINPDAHRIEGIRDMYYGVCVARKGMLLKQQTFNSLDLQAVTQYLGNRKNRISSSNKVSA